MSYVSIQAFQERVVAVTRSAGQAIYLGTTVQLQAVRTDVLRSIRTDKPERAMTTQRRVKGQRLGIVSEPSFSALTSAAVQR